MARHGTPEEVQQIGETIQGIAEQIQHLAEQAARTISSAAWNDEHQARLNGEVSDITSPIQNGAGQLIEVASRIKNEAAHYE